MIYIYPNSSNKYIKFIKYHCQFINQYKSNINLNN